MNKKQNYDIKTLRALFVGLDDNKSKLAMNLLDKAQFMENTLQELKARVEQDGTIVEMCQGKYNIEREHPALKGYNTTIKNYASIIKQLSDLLPKTEQLQVDSFEDFGNDLHRKVL